HVGDCAIDPGAGADGGGIGLAHAPPVPGDAYLVTHRRGAHIAVYYGERAPFWKLAQGTLRSARGTSCPSHITLTAPSWLPRILLTYFVRAGMYEPHRRRGERC